MEGLLYELGVIQVFCPAALLAVVAIHAVKLYGAYDGELRLELSLTLIDEILSHTAPVARRGVNVRAVEELVVESIHHLTGPCYLELFVLECSQDDRNLFRSIRLYEGRGDAAHLPSCIARHLG